METTREEQSQPDVVWKINLPVNGAEGFLKDANTLALVDAVGLRTTDDDIDSYIDRHEIAVLAPALTDPIARFEVRSSIRRWPTTPMSRRCPPSKR